MKKSYATNVVFSLTTGILVSDFGEMQELAEHVLGRGVWTHELAEKSLWRKMAEFVYAQHPKLREAPVFVCDQNLSKDQIARQISVYNDAMAQRYGASLEIESGDEPRAEDPVASAQRIMKDIKGHDETPILVVVLEKL